MTAYNIEKRGRPFLDMEAEFEIEVLNGVES